MTKFFLIVAIAGLTVVTVGWIRLSRSSTSATQVTGSAAANFSLPATTGGNVSLADFRGKKNVLLYFQEGIMCDPCWQQIEDIQKAYNKFTALEVELVTVTVDPLNALKKESARRNLTLPVLDDVDLAVSKAYGMLEDSMHPGSRPGHSFVLINKEGQITWQKHYYPKVGGTKMPAMMGMGAMLDNPNGRMYVPPDELLKDMSAGIARLGESPKTPLATGGAGMSSEDHAMCRTPIHYHTDFKLYINGVAFNFSQRNFMDQSSEVHFHPTVKVKPDEIPGIPIGDIIHVHKEEMTLRKFFETLDVDAPTRAIVDDKNTLQVYVDSQLKSEGLEYVLKDKERVLVTNGPQPGSTIAQQMESVTNHAVLGKEKNPSLLGGC